MTTTKNTTAAKSYTYTQATKGRKLGRCFAALRRNADGSVVLLGKYKTEAEAQRVAERAAR
jgi:hypothetical protein